MKSKCTIMKIHICDSVTKGKMKYWVEFLLSIPYRFIIFDVSYKFQSLPYTCVYIVDMKNESMEYLMWDNQIITQ